ncbi:glycosyl transferase family protein [Hahella ganghwensis]|uniref:glycosyl transferase family protein n=1 Tax=Hahella ganghwensis TaxID=286420 RepID=UPI00036DC184|nr:glycosyl transferase family protein [Hahella ganghwensis]
MTTPSINKASEHKSSPKEGKFPKEHNEHPFAPFVRILGKGKKGSRSLTREEARSAMGMIIDKECLDLQLGAFLMLLRVKEESPDELAGFVEAAQERFHAPRLEVDIDWSSYAGKKRHQPWFILSALMLSQTGIRIFMHGAEGHTQGRLYTRNVMTTLGLPVAENWEQVEHHLDAKNFAYLPLEAFSPRLHDIIQMRSILGLRSPVHSMARLLNPLNASLVVQGIFHPPYSPIHQLTGQLLNYPKSLVIKGEGGEFERNPDGECLARYVADGKVAEETWPAMFERRHVKPDSLEVSAMQSLWRGESEDEYAVAAVISTAALTLRHLRNLCMDEAMKKSKEIWAQRNKTLL